MKRKGNYKTISKDGFKIPESKREEAQEIFVRQLKSMGMSSEEIKKELKRLLP